MNFIDQIVLVELLQERKQSLFANHIYQQHVLKHLDSFTTRDWGVFVSYTEIIASDMKVEIDFWKEVYKRLQFVRCDAEGFTMRESIRISVLKTVCRDTLLLPTEESAPDL